MTSVYVDIVLAMIKLEETPIAIYGINHDIVIDEQILFREFEHGTVILLFE